MKQNKINIFSDAKSNLASGLVVFLVALPLCLGIALASGATPLSGIISGIVGGIVVGFLSTSHISVTGPAAGLTAIILASITELGAFDLFLCAGIIAGITQLILGFMKAGSISNYIPTAVIEGMLAGIGIIIILTQLPHAIGVDSNFEGKETLFEDDFNFIPYITEALEAVHSGVFLIFIISLIILIVWEKIPALKNIKMLPAALLAVASSIGINQLLISYGSSLAIGPEHLVKLPIPKTADDFKTLITWPNFSGFGMLNVWITGITIAIVASIETLLCIEAADRMDAKKRITDTNQELRAQGLGNLISSLIGGLPMTSVVVRSSANVNAGASSKLSAIIHGVLLLVCVLSIPSILNMIPMATLAAVLILVGYKLANPATIMHFWAKGKFQFLPFIATMLAVVFTDLLKGVALGLVISILFILLGNMKRAYYLSRQDLEDADVITIELAEEVSFLNKAAIKKTLKNIQAGATVTINAKRTSYIATDVLELLQEFANVTAKENNITVKLIGFRTDYRKINEPHVVIEHRRSI
ncbi:SulP family inorganic anion transporter [Elizabethkingia argentiflava]|uniref:SulP family inorganic anion transporter n=1 Tax=Elizabethkingia argenteiflava TaxID=2681556 RepID=A0A845PUX2_9FLAO|nr:SulP family inorganic anion transporter [Elizabethkingia argenteiflava]NAW52022.1 SulP family inorganic anion transporter [Elizabethkingia argenteiflava]